MYSVNCMFCNPRKIQILKEIGNLRILLDDFPISKGHILISTKAHYNSAGELPNEILSELIDLKEKIFQWMKFKMGYAVFYEHGRVGSCSATNIQGNDCGHMHLHCVPINICIHQKLMEIVNFKIDIAYYFQIKENFYKFGNYLFFENSDREMGFYIVNENNVKPHFLRTLLCEALGQPALSDWQSYAHPQLYKESYKFAKELRKL